MRESGGDSRFWVYILRSESTGRYYCGQTKRLDERMREHNDPEYATTLTTKRFPGPWELVWFRECTSRSEALQLEKRIKKRGIGRYLGEAREGR